MIVTGASSGLGEQMARALAAAGAVPVLAARRAERLEALREELPGADAVTCDVTDAADRERLVDEVMERHGRLDGLVNNAGAGATAPALQHEHRGLRPRGRPQPHRAVRALLPGRRRAMREATAAVSIVNVASVMGLRSIGEIPDAAYVASKAGIIGLTRELASQWGRYGDPRQRGGPRLLRLGDDRRAGR